MFQPTTECVDSLTIDDVNGQAVELLQMSLSVMQPLPFL